MSRVSGTAPTLRIERALLRERGGLLAAVDEVGRGALAGPVSVGVVVIDAQVRAAPQGIRDSKLLTPAMRTALVAPIRGWALGTAVGHASNAEIDEMGIIAALRRGARRALDALHAQGLDVTQVLLDGSHDWLTPPPATLFDEDPWPAPFVTTRVKADLTCAAVAAASVLAKVERDALMLDVHNEFPAYGWAENKGYASARHREALLAHGPTGMHRLSWNLLSTGTPEGDIRPQEDTAT